MKYFFRIFNLLHVALYRLTKGMVGGQMSGFKVLLLTTVGRKSGRVHTVPLGAFEHREGLVIVASNAGGPHNPGWYHNLKSKPLVSLQLMGKTMPATAEVLGGEARAQAWQKVIATAPAYGRYEHLTTRTIPLVLLRPGA